MKAGIIVDNELNNDTRVLKEISILKEQGHEIFVLCFGYGKTYETPVGEINVTRININKKIRDILFFFLNTIPVYEWIWSSQIRKFILINHIEVLHVHDLYMSRSAFNGIRKTKKPVPMILDLHENYPYAIANYNWTKGLIRSVLSQPGKWQEKEPEYLRYATRIIVLSDYFRDDLLNRYSDLSIDSFTVFPNVPDLSQLKNKSKISVTVTFNNDHPVILYYGIIAERRGILMAMKILSDLIKENYHVNFLLIGPIDKKDRKRFFTLLNQKLISDNIQYIPWIDSTELPAYLEISDICLAPFIKNPQHESGIANKIYEYMLGGKPIIASDCKPQKELIEKYSCGLVFREIAELKDAIIKLLSNSDLRDKMGENGHKAIVNHYNTGMLKKNLIMLYETIFDKLQ